MQLAVSLWKGEMVNQTRFVIFKSKTESRYSITEYGSSGIKQAFMSDGIVSGDRSVLQDLSQLKPENVTIKTYVETNAGRLIIGK